MHSSFAKEVEVVCQGSKSQDGATEIMNAVLILK